MKAMLTPEINPHLFDFEKCPQALDEQGRAGWAEIMALQVSHHAGVAVGREPGAPDDALDVRQLRSGALRQPRFLRGLPQGGRT